MGFLLVVLALVVGAIVVAAVFGALGQYRQELKDPDAVYDLGMSCFERGKHNAAMIYFQRAAQMGHAGATYFIGLMHITGRGVEQNSAEAFRWYQLAAERGLVDAQCDLAELYQEGIGVDVDLTGAYHYYRLAADQGFDAAVAKAKEFEDVAANPELACEYSAEDVRAMRIAVTTHHHNLGTMEGLKRAVEFGDREAAFNVSLMYLNDADDLRAYEWMRTASEMGNKLAKLVVRMMRPENRPSKERLRESFILYEAAKAGDPAKLHEVGRRFLEGVDVDVDPTEAAVWFLMSYKHPPSRAALNSIPRDNWPEEFRDEELPEIA